MNSPEEFVLAAERRLNSDPQTADLTTALLSEVMEEFDCGHVTLLQRHRSTEVLEHLGACAPVSELPDVSPGNVHWQSRKTKTISLAAAALTDDQQLLLHAEFEDRVPDEHLLSALVEILADIRRRCLLSQVMTDAGIHQRESFAIQLFSSLDFSDTVHTIATDGAVVTGATRVTVARRIGQEWIVQATTGVTETNDRSDAVRKIRELIARQESQQSPSAAEPNALVAPLHRSGDWSETDWAIVFEFAAPPTSAQRTTASVTTQFATTAVRNCSSYAERTILGQVSRRVRSIGRRRMLLAASASVLVVLSMLIPADFSIEVQGVLVPADRRFVFAPEDGIVSQLPVTDGMEVEIDAPLCMLENSELETQHERLVGDLAGAEARLAAIAAIRGDPLASPQQSGMLSAEEAELNQKADSLRKQLSIVNQRISALSLKAESAGRIYGLRLQQTLFRRPVQRGQFLFETADPEKGWQLELQASELDIRHILEAESAQDSLRCRFTLRTSPEKIRHATIRSISQSTEISPNGTLETTLIADADSDEFKEQRSGAGVLGSVYCGRRAIGYVWMRKVIEFIQRRTWL